MKEISQRLMIVVWGAVALAMANGCATVVRESVRGEMQRKNEADLKSGSRTPGEYRERRDEIDRNLK